MKSWLIAALLLGSPLLAGPTAAQPLTLEQALQQAEAASLDVAVQDLALEVAQSAGRADPQAGSPSLRMRLRDLGVPGGTGLLPPELAMRGRFPLPRPWDLAGAARAAQASTNREQAQRDLIVADLHLAVSQRFHTLPILRQAAGVAQALLDVRVAQRDLVERRRLEGLSTVVDWLDAEEARRDAADDLADLGSRLRELESDLRRLLGLDESQDLDVTDTNITTRAAGDDLDALVADAGERSPKVAEAIARLTRDEARLDRDRLRGLPWLDWVEAGVVTGSGQTLGEVGVAIDIPVYRWSAATTQESRARVLEARLRLDEERAEARRSAARQVRDVQHARESWKVALTHRQALQKASESLLLAAGPVALQELKARLLRAELRELNAQSDLILQFDQLLHDAGR